MDSLRGQPNPESRVHAEHIDRPIVSVMLCGVGKWRIASRSFLHGRTLSFVILNPANSTVSTAKMNLERLSVMP